jgi:hypothetical protein
MEKDFILAGASHRLLLGADCNRYTADGRGGSGNLDRGAEW